MIGYFALAIVISLGVIAYNKSGQVNEVSLISTLINETRQLRSSQGYGTADYSAALIAAGSVPGNVTVSGGEIYNRAGGVVSVKGNGVGFSVTDNELPSKECVKLVQSLSSADFSSITINSQSFSSEISAADASTACTADKNTVIFNSKS